MVKTMKNLNVIYVTDIENFGKYAKAEKIGGNANIASFIKQNDAYIFMVVETFKKAEEMANDWNRVYRETGQQK